MENMGPMGGHWKKKTGYLILITTPSGMNDFQLDEAAPFSVI